ncbi:MAG: type II toxin-antitoxin system RelE/ParE family toxin [bacterium]|nr:type II toxin-antitoxin system RelE/ParE family toxin [bacterium]
MESANREYGVIVSDRASEMLIQHVRFLAQVNSKAAQSLIEGFKVSAKSLRKFPERNPWLADPALPVNKYRKLLVHKRYLLIYQIRGDTVLIDNIVDCRQDYGWLL